MSFSFPLSQLRQRLWEDFQELRRMVFEETRVRERFWLLEDVRIAYLRFVQSDKGPFLLNQEETNALDEYEEDEQEYNLHIRVWETEQDRHNLSIIQEQQEMATESLNQWRLQKEEKEERLLAEQREEVEGEVLRRWEQEEKEIEEVRDFHLGFLQLPQDIQLLESQIWEDFRLEQEAKREADLNRLNAQKSKQFLDQFSAWVKKEDQLQMNLHNAIGADKDFNQTANNTDSESDDENRLRLKPIIVFTRCQEWKYFSIPQYGVFQNQTRGWKAIPFLSDFDLTQERLCSFDVCPISVNSSFLVGIIQEWAISLKLSDRQEVYCICYQLSKNGRSLGPSLQGLRALSGERLSPGMTIRVKANAQEVQFWIEGRKVGSSAIPSHFIEGGFLPFVALFEEGDTIRILGELELY